MPTKKELIEELTLLDDALSVEKEASETGSLLEQEYEALRWTICEECGDIPMASAKGEASGCRFCRPAVDRLADYVEQHELKWTGADGSQYTIRDREPVRA